MKYLLLLFLFSCTKEHVNTCKPVGYLIDRYDQKGFVRTDTASWWLVCGDELKRFEAMSRSKEWVCGTERDSIYLVIK